MHDSILSAFGIQKEKAEVLPFGTGLINHTWKIILPDQSYILQKINQDVFKEPILISENIRKISHYLQLHFPGYSFVAPISTTDRNDLYIDSTGCYRLFPFVNGSHTIDVVENIKQAREAAVQFGRLTFLLSGFDASDLHNTIPRFHDLGWRYEQFLHAMQTGNQERIEEEQSLVKLIMDNDDIVTEYHRILNDPGFKIRVTHHDTKISNVLLDKDDNGICVIDLDTVMPGYFFSDVGDMMRTYLSPVSEEEKDFSRIVVRDDFYKAIVQGYYAEMKDELTPTEKKHFFYAGKFMIYMQALRFLTDYFNNDVYYSPKYPKHNLVRARNQSVLLQRLMEKEKAFASLKFE